MTLNAEQLETVFEQVDRTAPTEADSGFGQPVKPGRASKRNLG